MPADDCFRDDLLLHLEERKVISLVGPEPLTVPDGDRSLTLDRPACSARPGFGRRGTDGIPPIGILTTPRPHHIGASTGPIPSRYGVEAHLRHLDSPRSRPVARRVELRGPVQQVTETEPHQYLARAGGQVRPVGGNRRVCGRAGGKVLHGCAAAAAWR
jgi:hypothetical protein